MTDAKLTPTPQSACDVLVIGMGPVGKLIALLIARQGHRVMIVERKHKPYPLPRAVTHDAEIARILQFAGLPPNELEGVSEPYDAMYYWVNRADETLHMVDWSGIDPSGWNNTYFYHQPSLEARLEEALAKQPSVEIRRGAQATLRQESDSWVDVDITELETGESVVLRTSFVIGADGANSAVRQRMGIEWHDLGYFFDWLVVDIVPKPGLEVTDLAKQVCDYERPTTMVPGGPGRRRWEFMRLENETAEELMQPEKIWELLAPHGVTPGNAELERGVVYTFRSAWAASFRTGRVFIMGDAAHLMPPFAGQGLAAGMRDAANLSWKLDLVLRGVADDAILDTYGPERIKHVSEFIDFSMGLGRIICITDPAEANARDARMKAELARGTPAPPPAPKLGEGLHQGDHGGYLSRQGRVQTPVGNVQRFDDVFSAANLILSTPEMVEAVDESMVQRLAIWGIGITTFSDEASEVSGVQSFIDVDGTYRRWFDELGAMAVLIRPDFYVFGTAHKPEQLAALVDDFTVLTLDKERR